MTALFTYMLPVVFWCVQDKQHIFVAGMSDKKIVQWDTTSGEIMQEYDRHLNAVNTISFIDDNKRIVSTSDDKSIRVWEWYGATSSLQGSDWLVTGCFILSSSLLQYLLQHVFSCIGTLCLLLLESQV